MRFEYPITENYVGNWSPLDAIREFGANAIDAELQLNSRKSVKYDRVKKVLRIRSEGVTLNREALLLGGTTKTNDDRVIGEHGEGMKLGLLVLTRNGFIVVVRNGRNEDWKPSFEFSDKWQARVLTLNVTKSNRPVEFFEVEIHGIDDEMWVHVQGLFRFLIDSDEKRELSHGTILFDPEFVGNIYVKGVFIGHRANHKVGYDFNTLDLGRDRRLPSDYEIHPAITALWDDYAQMSEGISAVYELIQRDQAEAQAFRWYTSAKLKGELATEFMNRHGEDAQPALTSEECEVFKMLGGKPVLIPGVLGELLQKVMGGLEVFKGKNKGGISRAYSVEDLNEEQRTTFISAREIIGKAGIDTDYRITLVDFLDESLLGLYTSDDIRISMKTLTSVGSVLVTILHELAHDYGSDAKAAHRDAFEYLTEKVFCLFTA